MKSFRLLVLLLALLGSTATSIFAQTKTKSKPAAQAITPAEQGLLWEVSGQGLAQPSYLFGTFHRLTSAYLDSLPQVQAKFAQSQTVVGEMLMDSTVAVRMMQASLLPAGITLRSLLDAPTYSQTAEWFKQLTGADLARADKFNPMLINLTLTMLTYQKQFPQPPAPVMDLYFQQAGRKAGKRVVGLESFEDQLQVLFGQFSLARQAELLQQTLRDKDRMTQELTAETQAYRQQNLARLAEISNESGSYSAQERARLLDARNQAWMRQLPKLLAEQPTFVAVGAAHLPGPNGLIALLRRQGYTVQPVQP